VRPLTTARPPPTATSRRPGAASRSGVDERAPSTYYDDARRSRSETAASFGIVRRAARERKRRGRRHAASERHGAAPCASTPYFFRSSERVFLVCARIGDESGGSSPGSDSRPSRSAIPSPPLHRVLISMTIRSRRVSANTLSAGVARRRGSELRAFRVERGCRGAARARGHPPIAARATRSRRRSRHPAASRHQVVSGLLPWLLYRCDQLPDDPALTAASGPCARRWRIVWRGAEPRRRARASPPPCARAAGRALARRTKIVMPATTLQTAAGGGACAAANAWRVLLGGASALGWATMCASRAAHLETTAVELLTWGLLAGACIATPAAAWAVIFAIPRAQPRRRSCAALTLDARAPTPCPSCAL